MAENTFKCEGKIDTLYRGISRNGGDGFCFMRILVPVPGEQKEVRIQSVSFEKISEDVWNTVSNLKVEDNVKVVGYFHSRKQVNPNYVDSKGKPIVIWFNQLVIQEIEVV